MLSIFRFKFIYIELGDETVWQIVSHMAYGSLLINRRGCTTKGPNRIFA